MEARAKVTKEVLCEEARFILANVLAEGRYGRQNKLADIRRICEGAVSIPFGEYVGFLEAAGYLVHDRGRDTLDVTSEGERVVTGERVTELMERAVAHFKGKKASQQAAARPANAAVPAPVVDRGSAAIQAPVAGGGGPPVSARGEILARDVGGRYERLGAIGSGGIGTVYRARQTGLDREVALKEVRELFAFFGDEQRREIVRRFTEVCRAAGKLSHPNIVPLHDVALDRDYPYVVSELCPQGSVRRLISDAEDIPVQLAVKYLVQVLHALRAAHDQGVSHRGLKPENLLIDAHGNVKVSDFGFARIVERDQAVIRQVYVGMGAVAYMAPELFTDPLGSGPQTDIYAIGIIFYETLTRKLPGRRSPMPSQVNSSLPKGLDDIFDKMTRDERAERYNTVEEILEDFYKLDGMGKLVEGSYSVLFGDNPIKDLKFRTPAAPPPAAANAKVVADTNEVPLAESAAANASPAPAAGSEETRNRPIGRRPYSYQQRVKDRDKAEG